MNNYHMIWLQEKTAGHLVYFRYLIVLIFLVSNQLSAQECESRRAKFDWSNVEWKEGEQVQLYEMLIPHGTLKVYFEVWTEARGSFSGFDQFSPYLDEGEKAFFGRKNDLGVIFDPVSDQEGIPVVMKVLFEKPVQCASFEISDIDISGARRDSVEIFANEGDVLPHLSAIGTDPTVRVAGNLAIAKGYPSGPSGIGSAFRGEEAGNVLVTFGEELVDSITILYYEGSNEQNPSARGIGVFGNFTFSPVVMAPPGLQKFGVVFDDECMPTVRWVADHEFDLQKYTVEYSYDGFNFIDVGSLLAKNTYTIESEYELPLYRKLNSTNHFRLTRTKKDGTVEILTNHTAYGGDCFTPNSVNVFPNPSFGNHFFVQIKTTEQKPTDISIIDQTGEVLVQTRYELKKGENKFKVSSRYLVQGVYNIRFKIGDQVVTKRVSIID